MNSTPVAALARRLACSEGQLYTMLIALTVAIVLGATGIPPVLRARAGRESAAAPLRPIRHAPTATATGSGPSAATGPAPPPTFVPATPGPSATGVGDLSTAAGASTEVATGEPPPPASTAAPLPPGSITVFAPVGSPGAPGGLAVGADGTVYVTTDNGTDHGDTGPSLIFGFDAGDTATADHAVSGQRENHTRGLTGVAVHPVSGEVVALDPDGARILAVNMTTGGQRQVAVVPDLPACVISLGASRCQPGAEDRKPLPMSAAYDRSGNLFFTDVAQDTIWRLGSGQRTPEPWFQSPYFTAGAGPDGLVVGPGFVAFTVGATVDPGSPGGGGLYRLAVDADGTAGSLTLVAPFARGEQPGPLAIGSSGTAYVVLRRTGAIVSIGPDGSRAGQITPPGGGAIPLDEPSALALTAGRLLVANRGAAHDTAHWAVLAVSVNDGRIL